MLKKARPCPASGSFSILLGPTMAAAAAFQVAPVPGIPGPAPADTTVTIRSAGTVLAFEPDRISLTQGTTVRIRYVNESSLAHNLVIVRRDEDIDVVGPAAQSAAAHGFLPPEHKDRMIAWSPLADPGRTVEFSFVVPPAGEYPFVCLVDGHYNMMFGTLRSRR